MIRSVILFFLFSTISFYGTAQKKVIINGNIQGLKDGSKVYLVPNTLEKWRDSAIVQRGQFHFERLITHEANYSIRLSKNFEDGKWMDFYIAAGTLNITGRDGNFYHLQTSGSPYAQQYNDYLSFLRKDGIDRKLNILFIENADAVKRKDSIASDHLFNEYKSLYAKKIELIKKWITAHPSSPISAYLLYTEIRSGSKADEMEILLNRLFANAKDNYFGKTLQKEITAENAGTIGKIARDFTQYDTSGHPVSLHNFRGRYVLLDFWASWCLPCREENPEFVSVYNKYKDKNFTILGVSFDNERSAWIKAIQTDHLPWTQVSDLKSWDNVAGKKYDIRSLPANFLLDPQGKIIAKYLNGEELNNVLSKYLN